MTENRTEAKRICYQKAQTMDHLVDLVEKALDAAEQRGREKGLEEAAKQFRRQEIKLEYIFKKVSK